MDGPERLASNIIRYRVVGIDTESRIVIDLPSKTREAANCAARFMAETHPGLRFSVQEIGPP